MRQIELENKEKNEKNENEKTKNSNKTNKTNTIRENTNLQAYLPLSLPFPLFSLTCRMASTTVSSFFMTDFMPAPVLKKHMFSMSRNICSTCTTRFATPGYLQVASTPQQQQQQQQSSTRAADEQTGPRDQKKRKSDMLTVCLNACGKRWD